MRLIQSESTGCHDKKDMIYVAKRSVSVSGLKAQKAQTQAMK